MFQIGVQFLLIHLSVIGKGDQKALTSKSNFKVRSPLTPPDHETI